MKCKSNYVYEYCILTPDTAEEVLDWIGHGKTQCEETYYLDGRYGRVTDVGIEYGFSKSHSTRQFGNVLVIDGDLMDCCNTWYRNEELFLKDFTPITE